MKLNTKMQYAVRAMIELALNNESTGLYQKDIAERQKISYKYLDHIISALKAKGLIVNVDGKKSGYRLGHKPEYISVYDIFTAFEPNISVVDNSNDNIRSRAADDLWWGLNKVFIEYLKSNNLRKLSQKQDQYNTDTDIHNYVI